MRRAEDRPPSDMVLVFADRDQLDVQVTSRWTPLGMRGTDSVGMTLRGRVPSDQVLDPQRGFEHIATTTMIPVGHIGWAAAWLGAAQGALGRLIDIWRDPSGRNSSNLQSDLFAAQLGRIRMQIDTVEASVRQTLDEYDNWHDAWRHGEVDSVPRRLNIHINTVKTLAAELSFSAVDQLVQLAGLQHGYLRGSRARLEQTFRDLRAASLMYANDRLLVANGKLTLLDHDLLGEP
jgi:acyl-CoA dehydrogenase